MWCLACSKCHMDVPHALHTSKTELFPLLTKPVPLTALLTLLLRSLE